MACVYGAGVDSPIILVVNMPWPEAISFLDNIDTGRTMHQQCPAHPDACLRDIRFTSRCGAIAVSF